MAIEWLEVDQPPALVPLFTRALFKQRVSGDQLPSLGVRTRLQIDPAHLARYRHVCTLQDSAYLPALYPHVMAFALQMKLITSPLFPTPVLGLVHLENQIKVLRPMQAGGPLSLSVHLERLQAHPKGATFSLITQLFDEQGLLWEGDSRMLSRHLHMQGEKIKKSPSTNLELAPLASWQSEHDIGRRYARVAGDYNPIHVSNLSARLFGFPGAIAHGLWNKARCIEALSQHLPVAGYSLGVRFQRPVLLPAQLTLHASEIAPNGQFRLLGNDQRQHLNGYWQTD